MSIDSGRERMMFPCQVIGGRSIHQTGVTGRTLMLTGATGEIGGELLSRLLNRGVRRLYCLVRASDEAAAQLKLADRLGVAPEELDSRIVAVTGDMMDRDLGLTPPLGREIGSSIEGVVHCAASTSFLNSGECWRTNVQGLQHLLDFLASCSLQPRLIYLGSASAAGDLADICIHEDDYPRAAGRHFVQYAATKSAAELMLREASAWLDVVTVRPSMVIPDTRVPETILTECLWPLQLMKECRALPLNDQARVDLIPLSFAAEAIADIVERGAQHCYHISAGERWATRWGDVLALVEQSYGLDRPIRCVTGPEWLALRAGLSRREIVMLRAVSVYFPFINQNVSYDNGRYIEEFGAPPEGIFDVRNYLPALLRKLDFTAAFAQSRYD